MDHHKELLDFVEHWRGTSGFAVHPNGNCDFRGRVSYSFAGQTLSDTTRVYLIRNGYNDGTIRLNPTASLPADRVHVEFWAVPKQHYQFRTSDGAFLIAGKSPKMGSYSVTLTPI